MSDHILVNGLLWGSKEPLVRPIDYDEFVNKLLDALARDKEAFRAEASFGIQASATRGAFEFHSPDLNDPLQTKWALLLSGDDREAEDVETPCLRL